MAAPKGNANDRSTPTSAPPTRGVTTSELWLSVAGGGGIYQIATLEGGPTHDQAICAVALAIAAASYAIARAFTKRP